MTNVNSVQRTLRLPDGDATNTGVERKPAEENKDTDSRQQTVSDNELQFIEAVEMANRDLVGVDKRFEFSIHEGTKKIMVKVINDETGDTIKEIPPEKILDMVAKMWELVGVLVDRRI